MLPGFGLKVAQLFAGLEQSVPHRTDECGPTAAFRNSAQLESVPASLPIHTANRILTELLNSGMVP
jgi:hypothetical protein